MTDNAQAPNPAPAPQDADGNFRSMLGRRLVMTSILGLTALAAVIVISASVIAYKKHDPQAVLDATQLLLASLLPLFASWVGTILAFYYTKENFQAATAGALAIVRSFEQRLAVTPVDQVMMPRSAIIHVAVPASGLKDVPLAEIGAKYETVGANGKTISRLHFLDGDGRSVGILHRSTWAEMQIAALRATPAIDLKAGKLGDLLPRPFSSQAGTTFDDIVTRTVAFVAIDQTLDRAKAAMEAKPGCQDVMVTKTGVQQEPVLGWVSNVDIGRLSKA